jgi:hypothetical protein
MEKRLERDVDYEWAVSKAYHSNYEHFRENISKPEYVKKMKSFAIKHGFSLQQVVEAVKDNEVFARMFCKDPGKQSIHEKTAAKFIKDNKHVVNFQKLPGSGANSLFLHEGEIITKKQHDDLNLTSKSLDFAWEVKVGNETLKFYATHKYTNEGGGAQDHQFNEIIGFLNNANQVKKPNVFFLAICDGDYYQNQHKNKLENQSKLNYLKTTFSGKRTEAIAMVELDSLIDREIFKLKVQSPFLSELEKMGQEPASSSSESKKRSIKVR